MKPTSVFLGVLCCLSVLAAFYFAQNVVMPIVLATFLFFLLEPVAGWLESHKIARILSAPLLILAFVGVTALIGRASYSGFAKLAEDMPQYSAKIRKAVGSFQGKADEIQKGTANLIPKSKSPDSDVQKVEVIEKFGGGYGGFLLHGLDSVVSVAMDAFLIVILALFFLMEKQYLKPRLHDALKSVLPMDEVGAEIGRMTKGFFLGNFVVGMGTSAGFFAVFSLIGLENRFALALTAGFINLIPLLGAVLGALFPVAQAFLQFDRASPVLIILGSSVFLHFFVANVVIPKFVGSKINVNATASTLSLIFWGWLWGAVGLLLAIPLTAIIRILLNFHPYTQSWGNLIAEKSEGSVARIFVVRKRAS